MHSLTVEGCVQDSSMVFLVFSGTSDTIISMREFEAVTDANRPKQSHMQGIAKQAAGTPLTILGRATMQFRVAPVFVAFVAEITNDAMLGIDFLAMTRCVIHVREVNVRTQCNEVTCAD